MTTLLEFARAGDAIAQTTSKLEKVRVLAAFLQTAGGEELEPATRYFAGSVFPAGDERTLNVGGAAFAAVLREVSGADDEAIRQAWRRHADSGDVMRDLLSGRKAAGTRPIALEDLDRAFAEIAQSRGSRERTRLLGALLGRVTADEARYVAKLISGDMRIGLREGLVEEAVAAAFAAEPSAVSRAVMVTGDLGAAARLAREGRLAEAAPAVVRPPALDARDAGGRCRRGGRATGRGRLG